MVCATARLIAGTLGKPDWRLLGLWENGPIRLEETGMQRGDKVRGTISAEIGSGAWEDFNLTQLKKAP